MRELRGFAEVSLPRLLDPASFAAYFRGANLRNLGIELLQNHIPFIPEVIGSHELLVADRTDEVLLARVGPRVTGQLV